MYGPSSCDGASIPLLKRRLSQMKRLCVPGVYKSVLIVLLWQFSTGLLYNTFMRPTRYILIAYVADALLISLFLSLIFMFSPLTGFIADVKSSRLRVLSCGTIVMLISLVTLLVTGLFLLNRSYNFDTNGKILLSAIALSFGSYSFGEVLFLSNIVQFGTDQLRDAPTRYSVYFIHAYFWTDSIGDLITSTTYLPGREIVFDMNIDTIAIDKYRTMAISILIMISIILTSVILYFVSSKKHSAWFLSNSIVQNPYKLVYNILRYAVLHNKPTRRSAFTFCDDERPTRIDFGKQRYGGPFSTEQVEDVKVMLNILIVLFSISPIFLLEGVAAFSFKDHAMHSDIHIYVNNPFMTMFIGNGMIVPLSAVIGVPLFQLAGKIISPRYTPNIFKKMGMPFGFIVIQLLIYFLFITLAFDSSADLAFFYTFCKNNETFYLNKSLISFSSRYVSIIQQILFSIFQVILYTSAYEFICCQSPQHMKGLLFGLFYALRAFNQCLAAATIYLFISYWYSTTLSCGSAYYIFTLCIAVTTLCVYIIVARKFKYRKRDDICHIYKFAEDYYSNIQ